MQSVAADEPKNHVDPSSMRECNEVVDVPHRFVPWDEGSTLWGVDRASLGECWRLNHAKGLIIKALTK
ncbi:hypothetical protein [Mesorhizobium silamurunense]|uniref:hypothetical protein n=1 Tax=Mesorhizobium silamurunense TaxID=499528 RepID=UPI00177ED3CE|nr:hypothetical protein [Mesorhizobium silamurunense]